MVCLSVDWLDGAGLRSVLGEEPVDFGESVREAVHAEHYASSALTMLT
jgi:hypothetical protein